MRQRCVDVIVVRENAYYFSLFSNLKIFGWARLAALAYSVSHSACFS